MQTSSSQPIRAEGAGLLAGPPALPQLHLGDPAADVGQLPRDLGVLIESF